MGRQAIKILWVEDNIGDILLIKEAFQQAYVSHKLNVITNGSDALDYLFRRGCFAHAHRPDLIILDLQVPQKSGREVIKEIKSQSHMKDMPLVVLTTSKSEQDVLDGYDPKHCLYLVKPLSFDALVNIARQIQNFYFSLVQSQN
jgi:two-component system, chemotaxis family, response regulator Rcp1